MDSKATYTFTCPECGETWTEDYRSVRHSEARGFYSFCDCKTKVMNPIIGQKKERKRAKAFEPSDKVCTVLIHPEGESEKAYMISDGSNGKVSRGNYKAYYKFVPKSVCYVDSQGSIYAPAWAI